MLSSKSEYTYVLANLVQRLLKIKYTRKADYDKYLQRMAKRMTLFLPIYRHIAQGKTILLETATTLCDVYYVEC